MYLDENLNWKCHVEYIINKLVKLRGAFNYLSKVIDDKCIKQLYYAYVYPYIQYGVEVYGNCGETVIRRLQTQQNKLLKILCQKDRTYGTNQLHKELKLLKCKDIYHYFVGIFVYKQQNYMLPEIFNKYYNCNHNICVRHTRQSKDLYVPLFRTKVGQNSLRYTGAKLWNNLNENTQQANSRFSCKKI